MGNQCPKWSNNRLLSRCQMQTIYQMINDQALNYIHKIQSTKTPQSLYTLYNIPHRPQRNNPQLKPLYNPKTKQLKASLFFKYSTVYNNLSQSLKSLQKIKFKKQIKSHIQTNIHLHTIPRDTSEWDSDSDTDTD